MQPVSASDFIDCVLAFDGLERDLSFELSGVPLSPCLHRFLPPTRQPFYTLRGCPNFGVHYNYRPFDIPHATSMYPTRMLSTVNLLHRANAQGQPVSGP